MNAVVPLIKHCRSCGAAIVWMKTEAGRPMPVDVVEKIPSETVFDHRIHQSHFATCPNADKHRNSR